MRKPLNWKDWSVEQVAEWLRENGKKKKRKRKGKGKFILFLKKWKNILLHTGLERFVERFTEEEVVGTCLEELTESDLRNDLGLDRSHLESFKNALEELGTNISYKKKKKKN